MGTLGKPLATSLKHAPKLHQILLYEINKIHIMYFVLVHKKKIVKLVTSYLSDFYQTFPV